MSEADALHAKAALVARLCRSSPGVIQARTFHLKTYAHCFVGKELVTWMVAQKHAETRAEAVRIGRAMVDAHIAHHVTSEHDFEDEFLFYRFFDDDSLLYLLRVAHKHARRRHWTASASKCERCGLSFGLARRRHHCRNCGAMCCGDCSPHSIKLPMLAYLDKVRVCNSCHGELRGRPGAHPSFSSEPRQRDASSSSAAVGGDNGGDGGGGGGGEESDGVASEGMFSLGSEEDPIEEGDGFESGMDSARESCASSASANAAAGQGIASASSLLRVLSPMHEDDRDEFVGAVLAKLPPSNGPNQANEGRKWPLPNQRFPNAKIREGVRAEFSSDAGNLTITDHELHYHKQKAKVKEMMQRIQEFNTVRSQLPPRKSGIVTLQVDVELMLRFLRASKYRVQEAFAKCLKFEQLMHEYGWGSSLQPSQLLPELTSGFLEVLDGRDKEGRVVVVVRPGLIDMQACAGGAKTFQLCALFVIRRLLRSAAVQIKGVAVVLDLKRISRPTLRLLLREDVRQTLRSIQGCVPLRVPYILVVHHYKAMVELLRPFLTLKLNHRLLFVERVEEMLLHIDQQSLPVEYGGSRQPVPGQPTWIAQQLSAEQ